MMAKYELELEEPAARRLIRDLREGLGDDAARLLADALEAQIPIPVPVKVGAVVRTDGRGFDPAVFTRWSTDVHSVSPWLQANSDQPYRTDEIGRITEVLSPGVDL